MATPGRVAHVGEIGLRRRAAQQEALKFIATELLQGEHLGSGFNPFSVDMHVE